MKITVLDGAMLNPGDLSWDALKAYGELTVYDTTDPSETIARCKDSEIVLTNKVVFTKETMKALPALKYIGVTATGYNIIDVKAAEELGITVTNVPEYSTEGVAESVFAHILAFTHRVTEHAELVRKGEWQKSGRFSFSAYPLAELCGKRLGIVGMGHIGMRTAEIAAAFGMEVVYSSRSRKEEAEKKGFKPLPLNEVFSTSDFISLHVPQTEETKGMINSHTLSLMKSSAILINTARGGLIDEEALADALRNGKIAGAGLDVLTEEPPLSGSPLLEMKECIITPHIAWAAKETRERLMNIVIGNVGAYVSGRPQNVIAG